MIQDLKQYQRENRIFYCRDLITDLRIDVAVCENRGRTNGRRRLVRVYYSHFNFNGAKVSRCDINQRIQIEIEGSYSKHVLPRIHGNCETFYSDENGDFQYSGELLKSLIENARKANLNVILSLRPDSIDMALEVHRKTIESYVSASLEDELISTGVNFPNA